MPSLSLGPPRTKTEAIGHDTQVYSIMSLVIVAILLALELHSSKTKGQNFEAEDF